MGVVDDEDDNRFDLDKLRLPEDWQVPARPASVPNKIKKRREHFTKLPMSWYDRMKGVNGQTCRVAWYLLYLHWKGKGEPIKFANGMLETDGVSRQSKWRALSDLERRGLITIERHRGKSPIVRLLLV
jgi:hypothetical protein